MQHDHNQYCFTFQSNPQVEGLCKERICAYMVLYAPFPLIWYATWPFSEKNILTFNPHPRTEYMLACCFIPYNLLCNMTMFWKSWILTFWPQPYGWGGVSAGKIFATVVLHSWFHIIWYSSENVEFWPHLEGRGEQNICYHVAANVIPFYFICNMNIFQKKMNFDTIPRVGGSAGKIFASMLLHV